MAMILLDYRIWICKDQQITGFMTLNPVIYI